LGIHKLFYCEFSDAKRKKIKIGELHRKKCNRWSEHSCGTLKFIAAFGCGSVAGKQYSPMMG